MKTRHFGELMTRGALLSLCIAVAMFIGQANANDKAEQPAKEAASVNDSAAKERYEKLMEQAEGDGRVHGREHV